MTYSHLGNLAKVTVPSTKRVCMHISDTCTGNAYATCSVRAQ